MAAPKGNQFAKRNRGGRRPGYEEEEIKRRLKEFSPKVLDFLMEIFNKKPKGFSERQWIHLKRDIAESVLDRTAPKLRATEISGNADAPLRLIIDR